MDIFSMYATARMSIPEISSATGLALSTIRFKLKAKGILRSRADGVRIARDKGKLSSALGKKMPPRSEEWKRNISKAKIAQGDISAKGITIKPSGYVAYTRGEHKDRLVHVVKMEKKIGRRLFANEVVHHKDEDKQNNKLSNLQLMTRAEHAALHAKQNHINRKRNHHGQFE